MFVEARKELQDQYTMNYGRTKDGTLENLDGVVLRRYTWDHPSFSLDGRHYRINEIHVVRVAGNGKDVVTEFSFEFNYCTNNPANTNFFHFPNARLRQLKGDKLNEAFLKHPTDIFFVSHGRGVYDSVKRPYRASVYISLDYFKALGYEKKEIVKDSDAYSRTIQTVLLVGSDPSDPLVITLEEREEYDMQKIKRVFLSKIENGYDPQNPRAFREQIIEAAKTVDIKL